jgi:hypothetical protein
VFGNGVAESDEAVKVVTTSATGQVHVFDADGKRLKDLDVPAYCNMVRVGRPAAEGEAAPILVVGSGDGGEQMLALDGEGTVLWTLDLPASVDHCDSMSIAADRPWAAAGLRGGVVMVVETGKGAVIAQSAGLGQTPSVAWHTAEAGADPLLVVATGRALKAFRIVPMAE